MCGNALSRAPYEPDDGIACDENGFAVTQFGPCLAPTNKSLARKDKSLDRIGATKGRYPHFKTVAALIMNESIKLLRSHFGLTHAEARLALHLVAGETLRCTAVKLSITYETARSQLKSIFKKTRTHRQAELVIVVLTALPGRLSSPLIEPIGNLVSKNKAPPLA